MTKKIIPRRKKQEVEELLRRFSGVVLLGQRHAGTTQIAKDIAKEQDADYLDLSMVSTISMLDKQGLRHYIEQSSKKLTVLDEIQMRRDLFNELRGIIERKRSSGARSGIFLLLGSASLPLANKSSETLTGRIDYVDLDPIDILEISSPEEIDKLWLRGGLPASFTAASDADSFDHCGDILNHLLVKELSEYGLRIEQGKALTILELVARAQGDALNMLDMAAVVNVDMRKVTKYINLLCDLLIVRKIPAYINNTKVRHIKRKPKFHFRDSGLLHCLLGLKSSEALRSSDIAKASWKSFAIENILRQGDPNWLIYHYCTKHGLQIDLLTQSLRLGLWAMEFKRDIPEASRGFIRAIHTIKPDRAFVVHDRYGMPRCRNKQGIEILSLLDMCREVAKLEQQNGE